RHSAVVERDRKPRANYQSIAEVVQEVRRVEPILRDAESRRDAQILYSYKNAISRDRASEGIFWMEIQLPEGWEARMRMWEKEVRRTIYQPLVAMGLTPEFVREDEEWDAKLPLFAPDLDIC